MNRAYAADEGLDPEYFAGKNYFKVYPDEELEPVFRKVVETGEPYFAFEQAFEQTERFGQEVTYWDWSLLPVKEADGKIVGLVLTLIDVTGRKKAEEELRRANAYNRSLIEAGLDPLVTIGPDGKITDVNAATEAATGRVAERPDRHRLLRLFH